MGSSSLCKGPQINLQASVSEGGQMWRNGIMPGSGWRRKSTLHAGSQLVRGEPLLRVKLTEERRKRRQLCDGVCVRLE